MDNTILITEQDYLKLSNLILMLRNQKKFEAKYLQTLEKELMRAKKIDSRKIEPDVVTMNTEMEILDMDSLTKIKIKLVYPEDANIKKGLISVISPLGSALLGYKSGALVSFETPKGTKKIRIISLLNQPESKGNYYL